MVVRDASGFTVVPAHEVWYEVALLMAQVPQIHRPGALLLSATSTASTRPLRAAPALPEVRGVSVRRFWRSFAAVGAEPGRRRPRRSVAAYDASRRHRPGHNLL
jgi:hypothetical protein